MIYSLLMIVATQSATPPAPTASLARLLVVSGETSTTQDYPTVEACELARERVVTYNRRRMDEELKRQKWDKQNHVVVSAACLPL